MVSDVSTRAGNPERPGGVGSAVTEPGAVLQSPPRRLSALVRRRAALRCAVRGPCRRLAVPLQEAVGRAVLAPVDRRRGAVDGVPPASWLGIRMRNVEDCCVVRRGWRSHRGGHELVTDGDRVTRVGGRRFRPARFDPRSSSHAPPNHDGKRRSTRGNSGQRSPPIGANVPARSAGQTRFTWCPRQDSNLRRTV